MKEVKIGEVVGEMRSEREIGQEEKLGKTYERRENQRVSG